ncbi:hypothetical protein [Moritella yayanosii]|uniref:Tc toxin complex TcA C-terminal TcB-binding domain-containing protein n=1 Tax=Moritella yayanosii TaxID=69539 RepID=A0A330LUG7_9GAMM|nr:hypothetical protein [Moritella yayanosii]SQD77625.1 conserved exported protein of unknown function [Moritella yayanosii]
MKVLNAFIITLSLLFSFAVNATEWLNYYKLPQPKNLPDSVTEKTIVNDGQSYLVSGMQLDLSTILNDYSLMSGTNKPNVIVIVADTLVVTESVITNLTNQRLFIFARNITGDSAITLNIDARSSNSVSLGIFAKNINDNINVITLLPSGYEFDIVVPVTDGFGEIYTISETVYNKSVIKSEIDGLIAIDSAPYLAVFNHSFDMAASIFDNAPELSITMLDWVENVLRFMPVTIAQNVELKSLYLQVSNLKQFIQLSYNNPHYVPGLSHDMYEYTYASYLDAMGAYEDKYQHYIDRNIVLADRKQLAVLMLEDLQGVSNAEFAIIDRSVSQVNQLRASLIQQTANYEGQETNILKAQITFRQGLETFADRATIQTVFDVVSAIANAGTAIAGSAGGDPSGLIKFIATLPDLGTKIILLKKRLDVIAKRQREIKESLAAIDTFSNDVKYQVVVNDIAKFYNTIQHTVPTVEASNLVWDEFLIDARADFASVISAGVGGATHYLAELERLAAQAKAISATAINLAQALSRQIDLRIASQVNAANINRVSALISSIDDDASAVYALEGAFFRTLSNLKRPMFIALANYQSAFAYWSLEESVVTASLNKSFAAYTQDLAFMREQEAASLDRFYPRPQDFTSIVHNINGTEKLEEFKNTGILHFTLPLNSTIFSDFDRVRLDEVSILIEGTGLPTGLYNIDLLSSGTYQDRRYQNNYTFTARPLFRRIIYNLVNSQTQEVNILTSGAIASDYALNYFMPTPFTTWTIKLNNWEDIDLSTMNNIKVSFSGNGIPTF